MIEMNRISAMKRFTALLAPVALMLAAPAFAAGDVDAGKAKAVTCQACHGADGNAGVDPQYPRLAGQYSELTLAWLKAYAANGRPHPVMSPIASRLNEGDMKALSDYIAGLR